MNAHTPGPGDSDRRLLVIGLDGFELGIAERFMAAGKLPNLRKLRDQSARFHLDHDGKSTGLAWEQFSTGRSPQNQQRFSSISFDPRTYSVGQEDSATAPFVAAIDRRIVTFDIPYFDMAQAPGVIGVTNWGAHDPGVGPASAPAGLRDEVVARFGPYPAPEWIYGFSWPSVEKTKAAGAALAAAVRQRREIAHWMLAERFPDWQVGIMVVAELHSAIEPFWHGLDAGHPLHGIDSAPVARAAIETIYGEIDTLVGDLADTFPDARILAFAMHGMGPNTGDVTAMTLVPELLYRHAFGKPYARPYTPPSSLADGTPMLGEADTWEAAMRQIVPWPHGEPSLLHRVRRKLTGDRRPPASRASAGNIGWMPAARYSAFWPKMPAFAIPAYYDAHVRINLAGREARGMVERSRYGAVREEIADLVSACTDPVTGKPVVKAVRFAQRPPDEIVASEPDLAIVFNPATLGFVHTRLGTIGPYPYRRTGGHTGEWGFLYAAPQGTPGDRGIADAYDVVPTIFDLLGQKVPADLSGRSLFPRLAAVPPVSAVP